MTARLLCLFSVLLVGSVFSQAPDPKLGSKLSSTYGAWRKAVTTKNAREWQVLTASHRKMEVRNRLVSEKRAFPAAVFELPAEPPSLDKLKLVHLSQRGGTAKGVWFGKVDFGVGGSPTDNLLVLAFVNESGRWLYDRADFVNLSSLPDVRAELAKGDYDYLDTVPEAKASGQIPPTPAAVPPAKYIAKVYAFCPGREVNVQINRISRHRFANNKEADVILGGARDGVNEITYTVKPLEGSTGKEAFALRVYLMSEIPGTKPIIAFERVVEEGGAVKGFESGKFNLDPATARKLVR